MQRLISVVLIVCIYILFSNYKVSANTNNYLMSSIEVTPWYILVGEDRVPNPNIQEIYNGIWISRDKGKTWTQFGLKGAGIKQIKYDKTQEQIYAITRYNAEGFNKGILMSEDKGNSWIQRVNNKNIDKLTITNKYIYYSVAKEGLFRMNKNTGVIQEAGVPGGNFASLISKNNIIIYSNSTGTYISFNEGNTWEKHLSPYIYGVSIHKNEIYYINNETLYKYDLESSHKISNIPITFIDNNYIYSLVNYSALTVYDYEFNEIYYMTEFPFTNRLFTSTTLYSDEGKTTLFTNSGNIFSFNNKNPIIYKNLFRIPWHYNSTSELIDKVSAYFDHEYPFLGYSQTSEPISRRNTTLNFFGNRDTAPFLYYSGHDAVDFALPYGTEILAARGGTAYYYYCADCGHTIIIEHPEGIKTIYMHLQEKSLITKDLPIQVKEGDVIGLIGMTGKTSGPHLHFGVQKDLDFDGNYDEHYPANKTDPFGWIHPYIKDPWENYSWTDSRGTFKGTNSVYLWKDKIEVAQKYINHEVANSIKVDNVNITIPSYSTDKGLTVYISKASKPKTPTDTELSYVAGTSFWVNLIDNLDTEIPFITEKAIIEIDLQGINLSNFKENSISIYHFDEELEKWEKVESILDLANIKILGYSQEFSNYAVFGELKEQFKVPATEIVYTPELQNWNQQPITINLNNQNKNAQIFFKLKKEDSWQIYDTPIQLNKSDIYELHVKAISTEDIENIQTQIIKVNLGDKFQKTIVIKDNYFNQ
jgi:murein DD-endopeptidase MepM/ murein hydrolase activator NlpD